MQHLLESPPAARLAMNLTHLNPQQRQAVETTEGPLLVLAGAGTGKTRVLTTRIAYILARGLAFPSQILSVTFTNKAAREMSLRVSDMVGDNAAGLWLGTFHSIALRMLRNDAAKVGLPQNFTVLDADDQVRLIKQLMRDNAMDEKRFPPANLSVLIQRWKDKALSPGDVIKDQGETPEAKLYSLYQNRLTTLGVVDFGDLLLHAITLLRAHGDVLSYYHRKFRYLLVDEYQDTNVAQYLWLRLLAQGSHNICCVGDDDQSIYGWRGAEVGNILKFEHDFSTPSQKATIIRLERNYRSTPDILAAAAAIISHNEERLGKTLYTEDGEGEKIKVISLWDDRLEASYVTQEIEAMQQLRGHSLEEIAILVRAGHQTRAFEERFMQHHIPYRIIGGLRFYERREIRDAIAYIRAVMQPTNDLALERVINLPKRGVGPGTLDKLREEARETGVSLNRAIRDQLASGTLRGKVGSTLEGFMKQLEYWREMLHEKPHPEVVEKILEQSGYVSMWKEDKAADAPGRLENLKELISALSEFASLDAFLEHVSLVADGDEAPAGEMVSVMTMHAAKGLEFNTVFLCGWEEGLFPSQRAMDEKGKNGLEEERRLAYVGITRARKHLFITFAANRYLFGQVMHSIPSRFVDELPEEHIERINTGMGPNQMIRSSEDQRSRSSGHPAIRSSDPPIIRSSAKGRRVFHQKFGYGTVIAEEGDHVTVDFEKSSTRTLLADYLEPA